MRHLLALAVLAALAPPLLAHPLPNMRFDRTVDVRIGPAGVVVRYTLDLNEWTMVLDGKKLLSPDDIAKVKTVRDYAPIYAGKKAAFVADNLRATLDGKELSFRVEKNEVAPEKDHLQFRFTLRGDWPPAFGKRVAFRFEDQNFENETGKVTLTLTADPGLMVFDLDEPAGLRGKSPLDLKPGEEQKLRRASAEFELPAAAVPAGPTPAPPPAAEPVVVGERPGLIQDVADRGLTALFDSGYGLGLVLLAAAVFGMGHAFTPGHGKTLVAAYLVGERGTIRHALVLGLTTTLAHTGSVIAIAAVLWWVYRDGVPESAQGWLQFAGGMLILVVGLWLLSRRVRGKADHVHVFGGHHHHHDHDHDHGHHHHHHHVPAEGGFGWARVVLLGIGGGIIPCWDAVMLLFVAISAGRLGLAVPLLLAFSVGLAAVLVALGVGVVLAHRAGAARFGERRWFQALPVLSAALLVGMGLWLARDGVQRLTAADRKPTAADVRG